MAANPTSCRRRLHLESLEGREMMTVDLATALVAAFVANSGSDDRYEPNDSMSRPAELGTMTSARTLSDLKMRDSQDWYRFRVGNGQSNGHVQINFQHSRGDLDMRLHNSAGREVGRSTGTGNQERISLAGLPAGEYSLKVYGYNGAHNRDYSLTVQPGTASAVVTPSATTSRPVATPVTNVNQIAAAGNAGSALAARPINFNPLPSTAPLPGRPMNNPAALPSSGIAANGVNFLNSILGPLPTTWAGVSRDPFVQQFTAPRNPLTDNGLGYLPWTATSGMVQDILRSDLAQHADLGSNNSWNTTMFGGTRPGIYYAVQDQIANNFANGSTAIDVSGVNRYYGIGDGNLDLLAQVSHGAFGPQTANRGVPIPMFQQWGWGAPIS